MPQTRLFKNLVRRQCHSDPKMVHDISPSEDVFIHQIKDSFLKEYRRYATDLMLILETRSEVKVTVTQKRKGMHTPPSRDAYTHQTCDYLLK